MKQSFTNAEPPGTDIQNQSCPSCWYRCDTEKLFWLLPVSVSSQCLFMVKAAPATCSEHSLFLHIITPWAQTGGVAAGKGNKESLRKGARLCEETRAAGLGHLHQELSLWKQRGCGDWSGVCCFLAWRTKWEVSRVLNSEYVFHVSQANLLSCSRRVKFWSCLYFSRGGVTAVHPPAQLVLWVEPRTSCTLRRHSTSWATSLASGDFLEHDISH